ncbi:MAG: hypothetical protein FWH11_11300 [Micrococcales bacterium]|nr:hypothetical protein [Micrococcales bacterium]
MTGDWPVSVAVVSDRFAEHVRAGVAAGLEGTGPFGWLILEGVGKGWLDRAEAVDLVLAALDATARPAERKAWLGVWLDGLHVTDDEVLARVETLIPVLATGDRHVLERLAPVLVAGVGDDLLADVGALALAAPTKKGLQSVLQALAARTPSRKTVEILGPLVTSLGAPARAVRAVVDAWGLDLAEPETHVEGLWQATPPVWQVPRFDRSEETPEALTLAAAELVSRGDWDVEDVTVERFLALANAVARRDLASARAALVGVDDSTSAGLAPVAAWVRGRPRYLDDDMLAARDCAVFSRLGQVPCLLSEPSTVDLRITPTDLATRLRTYLDTGASAAGPDLLLALTRLEEPTVDDESCAEFDRLAVPVLLQSGPVSLTAGQVARRYIADPLVEPSLTSDGYLVDLAFALPSVTAWHRDFQLIPRRVRPWRAQWSIVDGVVSSDRSAGLRLRQIARRADPLTSGAAVRFLVARRDLHPAAVTDGALALTEAWERGLLRPGVIDAGCLDRKASLAATATALGAAARDGLLSVVWPVLDDLLVSAASGSRLGPGVVEVVEVMVTFLPEVQHAVVDGLAEPSVLDLPGVRALATKSGTSRAVLAARGIVDRLPSRVDKVAAVSTGPSFTEIWPERAGTRPAVVDRATLTVTAEPGTDLVERALAEHPEHGGFTRYELYSTPVLRFDLTLPEVPDVFFEVLVRRWDRVHEGRCYADRYATGQENARLVGSVWLLWNTASSRLVVEDWCPEPVGWPTSSSLSTSLVAVVLGMCADNGARGRAGRDQLAEVLGRGMLGSASIRVAVSTLLGFPDVSPARLVGMLENPTTLPVLWPLLTEPIRFAGTSEGSPPRWLNRVLDVALLHAEHLREAARRGLIPADASSWPGLEELASQPGKTAALTKARTLLSVLRGA